MEKSVTFYAFLDRMKHPASLDLIRSIKSFLVSFSLRTTNSETSSKRVQDFFIAMEAAFKDHPLWANATLEDIDCALEGLEKYVMTKLFPKTFAFSTADVGTDRQIFDKIRLLRTFLRPGNLDIPSVLLNEASLLLAEKELLKINSFRDPRDKLLCVSNCCKVINNLLLNASMSENLVLAGADDFLPLLIYVTIKASPSWQILRICTPISSSSSCTGGKQKLISEAAYYLTNPASAKTFLIELTAKSLSIEEKDFEESMQAAKVCREVIPAEQFNEPVGYTATEKVVDPGTSARIQCRIL